MAILYGGIRGNQEADLWRQLLARELPDLEFRLWPDGVGDPADIEYTLVHDPRMGELKTYPNLKAIFTFGAGVDRILKDPEVPTQVPIVRLTAASLVERMSEYVIYWVLHYHRDFHRYREMEALAEWTKLRGPDAAKRGVGIMGVGELGADAARKLAGLGFAVAGWSRREKRIEGVTSFRGAAGLAPFLNRTEILVCLLPLTAETTGIVNARTLAALPAGAFVVNPARGALVVEADLLAAVDSGHIAAATLDVFAVEPLPADHPFWRHPRITVTPHIAAWTTAADAVAYVVRNIRRLRAGLKPHPVVDRDAAY